MNPSVQMAQAVAFQDTMATLLMYTYKQSFELKCPRENFQQKQSMIYVLLYLTNIIYAVFLFLIVLEL